MPEGVIKWIRPSGSCHELKWSHKSRELKDQELVCQVALSEMRSSNHCKDCRRKMHTEKKNCAVATAVGILRAIDSDTRNSR